MEERVDRCALMTVGFLNSRIGTIGSTAYLDSQMTKTIADSREKTRERMVATLDQAVSIPPREIATCL
jgi:hypothetical protein